MKIVKIFSEDNKSFYRLFYDEDFEFVDPIKYFKERSITSSYYLVKDQYEYKFQSFPEEIRNKVFAKKAIELWEEKLHGILNESLEKEFLDLLCAENKKDQLKLLRSKALTTNAFAKLLFTASSEFGFTFSRYTSEKLPGNLEKSQLPLVFELDDNEESISIIGETTLKEGELKNVILHRKNIVANFLDKGSEWHCFYLTFKALAGKESWNEGQPHYHYLSDKFGVSREEVIRGIKAGNVPSTPVHIGINGYREKEK